MKEETEGQTAWYALRTFNRREMDAKAWLEERGQETFVPMRLTEHLKNGESRPVRKFVPAVHNYLFCQQSLDTPAMKSLIAGCPWPLSLMKKAGSPTEPYLVSGQEMSEFRLLSDPDFRGAEYLAHDDAEAKPGKEVMVVHGAFKGVRGKLHRVKNDYFLIKTVGELAVQVRISRWYCRVLNTPETQTQQTPNPYSRRL